MTRFESRFERWSPEIAKAWKAEATAADGGGVLFDLGTHLLDQALQLFGPGDVVHAELQARRPGEKADDDCFLAAAARVRRAEPPLDEHAVRPAGSALPGARLRRRLTKHGVDPQEPYIVAGGQPAGPEYGVEAADWAGQLGRDGHLDRLPTERGDYPEFYRILADKISDGGASSPLPAPGRPGRPGGGAED